MRGILQDALRAMDDADRAAGLEAIELGHGGDAQALATYIGREALTVLCSAYHLDFEEVLTAIYHRATTQAEALLAVLGENPCDRHRQVFHAAAAGGQLFGFKLGLLVAEEIRRREEQEARRA